MPQQYDQDGNPIGRDNPYQPGDNGQPVPGYVPQGANWLQNQAEVDAARLANRPLTPEQKAAMEAARIERERKDLINSLRGISEGRGQAYGNTMKVVGQGNQRIAALAASGRGGINAGINAATAQATQKSAGNQQALANKEAEINQARSALGQVIAGGQDNAVQQGQDTLAALRAQYSTESTNAAQRYVGMAGQLGQAGFSVYGQNNSGGQGGPNDQNQRKNWG